MTNWASWYGFCLYQICTSFVRMLLRHQNLLLAFNLMTLLAESACEIHPIHICCSPFPPVSSPALFPLVCLPTLRHVGDSPASKPLLTPRPIWTALFILFVSLSFSVCPLLLYSIQIFFRVQVNPFCAKPCFP